MSPSESDLRNALHDGEDDAEFDVDDLLSHARAHAAQRRVRVLSTVAISAVLAGIGVGAAALISTNNASTAPVAGRADQAQLPHEPSASAAASSAGGAGSVGGAVGSLPRASVYSGVASCPTSPTFSWDRRLAPSDYAASTLFTRPVNVVVVCAYGVLSQSVKSVQPVLLELHGTQAKRLASSLQRAPFHWSAPCEAPTSAHARNYAIVGVASSGEPAGTVTVSIADPQCGVVLIHGVAVRFQWAPPQSLRNEFFSLTPK